MEVSNLGGNIVNASNNPSNNYSPSLSVENVFSAYILIVLLSAVNVK